MNQNFEKCLDMLLKHEGGYVNHPSDPGGMTNLGVTKRTYDEFHGTDIDEAGMRNLTVEDVTPIYRRNYWDRCRCGDLPSGVDWAVMDASVNHGTGRAAKFLQKAVMVEQDGAIGPRTIMAVNDNDPTEVINRMAVYRDAFYRSLSTFKTFGRGWIKRNDETREQSLEMARG
jgi:lysozyme family protein